MPLDSVVVFSIDPADNNIPAFQQALGLLLDKKIPVIVHYDKYYKPDKTEFCAKYSLNSDQAANLSVINKLYYDCHASIGDKMNFWLQKYANQTNYKLIIASRNLQELHDAEIKYNFATVLITKAKFCLKEIFVTLDNYDRLSRLNLTNVDTDEHSKKDMLHYLSGYVGSRVDYTEDDEDQHATGSGYLSKFKLGISKVPFRKS